MQRAVCVYLGHGIAQGWAGLGCGLSAALLPLVLPPATRTRILPIPPALPAALPPPCPTPPPCSYKEAWDSFVDAWLVVRVASPDYAYRWRLQAEQSMRASGRTASCPHTGPTCQACMPRGPPRQPLAACWWWRWMSVGGRWRSSPRPSCDAAARGCGEDGSRHESCQPASQPARRQGIALFSLFSAQQHRVHLQFSALQA